MYGKKLVRLHKMSVCVLSNVTRALFVLAFYGPTVNKRDDRKTRQLWGKHAARVPSI